MTSRYTYRPSRWLMRVCILLARDAALGFVPKGRVNVLGYQVVRSPATFDFARVHGIRIHSDGLDGGADPAGDGAMMAV